MIKKKDDCDNDDDAVFLVFDVLAPHDTVEVTVNSWFAFYGDDTATTLARCSGYRSSRQ